jgi:hypothetical protein
MIITIIIVRNRKRKTRIHPDNQSDGLCNKPYEKNARKPNRNKEASDSPNTSFVDELSPFFIAFQIRNEKIPQSIQTITTGTPYIMHTINNEFSYFTSLKYPSIIKKIIAVASKKYVTVKMEYNRSYVFIILGFSSILYSLSEKYYFIDINIFWEFISN